MRHMLPVYLSTGIGLCLGIYFAVFVLHYEPPILGWLFGAGGGLSLGAFIAALATNTPLVGAPDQRTHRGVTQGRVNDDLDELEANTD
jgi:hypothetical protein